MQEQSNLKQQQIISASHPNNLKLLVVYTEVRRNFASIHCPAGVLIATFAIGFTHHYLILTDQQCTFYSCIGLGGLLAATLVAVLHYCANRSERKTESMATNANAMNLFEEAARLATFQTWPSQSPMIPMSLAKAGFYHTGREDEAKCFSCGVIVSEWSRDDIPMVEHRKHSPACPFLQDPQAAGNIPFEVGGYRPIMQCMQASQHSESMDIDGAETFDSPNSLTPLTAQSHRKDANIIASDNLVKSHINGSVSHNIYQNAKHSEENMHYESNRLKSFSTWPSKYPVQPEDLAAAGFFYTGSEDECKCFCCRGRVLCWDTGDIPIEEHRKHFPTCLFLADPAACGNVPLQSSAQYSVPTSQLSSVTNNSMGQTASDSTVIKRPSLPKQSFQGKENSFESSVQHTHQPPAVKSGRIYSRDYIKYEKNRLETFKSWPKIGSIDTAKMAAAGLYFVGPGDKVKCAFCNGAMLNWDEDDDPANEHYKYFGDRCPLVKGEATDNMPLKGSEVKPRSTFDLLNIITDRPKHSRYAAETARLATFKTGDWPLSEDVQDVTVMAKAGFFFSGKEDQVTCFFCSLGLRNWEKTDDPWEQHARWTENCGFLRQVKGESYLHKVKRSHALIDSKQEKKQDAGHELDKRQVTAAMSLPMVLLVLNMGFERPLVQTVIEDKFKTTGENFPNAASLAEAVLQWQEDGKPVTRQSKDSPSPPPAAEAVQAAKDPVCEKPRHTKDGPLSIEDENRWLKEQRLCKQCKSKDADIVFLPCGHMLTCQDCAGKQKNCGHCGTIIRGTVKAYLG